MSILFARPFKNDIASIFLPHLHKLLSLCRHRDAILNPITHYMHKINHEETGLMGTPVCCKFTVVLICWYTDIWKIFQLDEKFSNKNWTSNLLLYLIPSKRRISLPIKYISSLKKWTIFVNIGKLQWCGKNHKRHRDKGC